MATRKKITKLVGDAKDQERKSWRRWRDREEYNWLAVEHYNRFTALDAVERALVDGDLVLLQIMAGEYDEPAS